MKKIALAVLALTFLGLTVLPSKRRLQDAGPCGSSTISVNSSLSASQVSGGNQISCTTVITNTGPNKLNLVLVHRLFDENTGIYDAEFHPYVLTVMPGLSRSFTTTFTMSCNHTTDEYYVYGSVRSLDSLATCNLASVNIGPFTITSDAGCPY